MELLEFLNKNKINLNNNIKNLCLDAITIMQNSNDPRHDYNHIKDLFDDLNKLIKYEKINIDFNMLLPAICWHDTWHAIQPATNNTIVMFFRFFYEGYGSAKLFKKYSKSYVIETKVVQKIEVAIIKHVRTGWKIIDNIFYNPFQLETKILKDLDELDTWNLKRLKLLKKKYLKNGLQTNYIWIIKWYLKNIMLNNTKQIFYLDYSKKEFKIRKKLFVDWVIKNYKMVKQNPTKYLNKKYKGNFFDKTPDNLKKELYTKL